MRRWKEEEVFQPAAHVAAAGPQEGGDEDV